jgi:hypothetical protein
MSGKGEIQPTGRGEIHTRYARTFRLTQATIDGLLSVAEVRSMNATAALEACIAEAVKKLSDRERLKLALLAAHCWRAGTLPPDRFRELLDMIAGDGDATAVTLRDERRALLPLVKANAQAAISTSTPTPAKVRMEVNA